MLKVLSGQVTELPLSGPVPSGPILVVCYTNHALDQFLEGIARFHSTGLVRVGGRGKNENLKKYNLRELKFSFKKDRFMAATFFTARGKLSQFVYIF